MKRFLASVGVAATALGTAGIAIPAASASPQPSWLAHRAAASSGYWYLTSATEQVTTNTGKTVHLYLQGYRPSSGKGDVYFSFSTGKASNGESHAWSFTSDALTAKAGKATINSRQDLGKYGSLKLTFSSSKKHSVNCTSGSESYWNGRLTGSITLSTATKKWGRFSRKSYTFTGKNRLEHYNNCATPPPPPPKTICYRYAGWGAPAGDTSSAPYFYGDSFRSVLMFGGRTVALKSPAHAYRYDNLTGPGQKYTYSGTGTKRTVTIKAAGGAFTGRATIRLNHPSSSTFKCTLKGKKYTETYRSWYGTWSSTGKDRLAAHMQIEGNPLLAPKGGTGNFYRYTYS